MKRHLFRRMGRFLRPQAPSLAGAAALAALSGLLALLVPLVAGWAVEAIGTGPGAADLTAVLRYCAAGLGAAVLSAVCSYGASAALVRVGQTVSYTLRKAAFQQITQLPVRYFDTHPAGDLISRVCYDVDTVNAALSTDLLQIGTSLLTVIGSFVMLLMLSPLLSGVFFLTVPLSVLLTRLQMKHIHPLFRRRSQELGALNSFAEERVSCQRAIRVYGVEAADLRQFAEKNDAARQIAERLSTGKPKKDKVYNTAIYRFEWKSEECVTIGLAGHILAPDFCDSVLFDKKLGWYSVTEDGEMLPADMPSLNKYPPVMAELLRRAGFKVDLQSMDWATLVTRRTKSSPVSEGGWNGFITFWNQADTFNPLFFAPLTGSGLKGWFGWTDDPKLEALKDEFVGTSDLAKRKELAEGIQLRVMDSGVYGMLGEAKPIIALRKNISGLVEAPISVFWGLKKD